jgi:hypothetical protein
VIVPSKHSNGNYEQISCHHRVCATATIIIGLILVKSAVQVCGIDVAGQVVVTSAQAGAAVWRSWINSHLPIGLPSRLLGDPPGQLLNRGAFIRSATGDGGLQDGSSRQHPAGLVAP